MSREEAGRKGGQARSRD